MADQSKQIEELLQENEMLKEQVCLIKTYQSAAMGDFQHRYYCNYSKS